MYTVYGNSRCVYCGSAKELLRNHELDFEYKNIDEDHYMNEFKIKMHELGIMNRVTIPQIYEGDRHIGGYTELKQELEENG